VSPEDARSSREAFWSQLRILRQAAVVADPADVTQRLRAAGGRSRLTLPLAFAGHALEAVVRGVLLLAGNWRLMLVELVPAVWIGAITWDWRAHVTGRVELVEVHGWVAVGIAAFVVAMNLLAYWCNAVFAFTLTQGAHIDLRAAFRDARERARIVNAWAISIGVLHAGVAVFAVRWSLSGYAVALGSIAVVQMYALVALPAALAGLPRKRKGPLRERVSSAAITATLAGIAAVPGFGLNRLAVVLIGLGLPFVGALVLAVAIVLQIAATSSAGAVKLATRLTAVAEHPEDAGQGVPGAGTP
jgi:hypothetical protein